MPSSRTPSVFFRRSLLVSGGAALGALALAACGNDASAPAAGASSSAAMASATPSAALATAPWKDRLNISHLFFHTLVSDPKRAFDGDEKQGGYLDYMVTISEFEKILDQLLEKKFTLVSPHELYSADKDGILTPKEPQVPKGRKPLVLSFDDLSYYEYMDGDGFPTKLKIADGKVVNEYKDASGKVVDGDYDYVPILDRFVTEHSEFSPNGTKGVVALTGYNGILGYRTSDLGYKEDNKNLEQDKKDAKEVAEKMKATGWEFASHSWGHLNFTEQPLWNLETDHEKWKAEVESLIGKTDLLIFPFGADIAGIEEYSEANPKFAYFKSQGFNAYFPIDSSKPAWAQEENDFLRQARINVDGISLKAAIKGQNTVLNEFFDAKSVLDPARPASISGS